MVINHVNLCDVILNIERLSIVMNAKISHVNNISIFQHIDEYDSFITHKRRKTALHKVQRIGIQQYNLGQQEKIQLKLTRKK